MADIFIDCDPEGRGFESSSTRFIGFRKFLLNTV